MLPNPLHPAVVHFPIALAVLLPLAVIGVLLGIHRGTLPVRAWWLPVAVSGLLLASAFVAVRTGEADEDRVEAVVPGGVLDAHEDAAERFLLLSGVLLLVAGAGLIRGNIGSAARLLTAAGSLGLLLAGVQVGAAGGELVYEHNAAAAYVTPGGSRSLETED